ncbi:thiolase family protein [Flindersiella endophytica]
MPSTRSVHVVAGVRTPIGRARGKLAGVRPDDLATAVVKGLLERLPALDPARIDDVYWGAANQAGEDNRNVARMAVLLAGLPETIPGATVNRLCASGLEAIASAARMIASGEADLCVAGGSESMSRAPYVIPRLDDRHGPEIFDTRLGWRMVNAQMRELYPPVTLGETAEEVAVRYGVSREEQDAFALRSHQRAAHARDNGVFADELLPVFTKEHGLVDADEGIRDNTSMEQLAKLRPAFRKGGTVTAGNSSPINDGAAGVVLASDEVVAELGVEPLARYVGTAAAGVHPDVMGIGPVPSTRKALRRYGWTIDGLGLVELNEAFASQSIAVIRELGLDDSQVNVNGGAIAIGHPLGCSGARLAVTLVHAMRHGAVRRGLATMCVGVGQGVSTLFELP